MADETETDVTQADDSSSQAASEGATSQDAQADSSTEQASGEKTPTLASIIKNAFEKSISSDDKPKAEDDAEEGESEADKDAESPKPEEAEAETETEEDKAEDKDKKGPIPYERFVEVNTAKNRAEQELTEAKPLLEAQRSIIEFGNRHGLSNEDFGFWMQAAALDKTDKAAALKHLEAKLAEYKGYVGEALPADVQAAVDAGEITLDYAKRLVAAENQRKFSAEQQQLTKEQLQAQAEQRDQQEFVSAMQTTLRSWTSTKQAKDTAFLPKKSANLPDGKYETFLKLLTLELGNSRIKTAADLQAVADRVYAGVDATVRQFLPKPANGQRHVRSSQANTGATKAPKTLREQIAISAARHGIAFDPKSS